MSLYLYLLAFPVITIILYLVYQNFSFPNEPTVVKSWIPFVGSGIEFSKDGMVFLAKQRARLGDIFTVVMGGKRMHMVLDHTAWDTVFLSKRKDLSFDPFAKQGMECGFGARKEISQIPELDAAVHNHYIKYLMGSGLDDLSQKINKHLVNLFNKDKKQQGVGVPVKAPLFELLFRLGWDAGVLTIFGESFSEGNPHLLSQFKTFDSKFGLLFGGAPSFAVKDAAVARQALTDYMATENFDGTESDWIKARRELFKQFPQLNATDRGQYNVAILWAAHSNSLPALFWFIYYVLTNKHALLPIRTEIENVLTKYGIKDSLIVPREAFKEMYVLDSCWQEVLRLRVGAFTMRGAMENTVIPLPSGQSLHVRKGDSVALFPYLHHHDPEIFPNPDEFQYDRFLVKDGKAPVFYKNGVKVKNALVPFGGGVSMCPGRFFIANEVKMLAVLMITLMDFEIDPKHKTPACDNARCGLGMIPPLTDVDITYRYRA